MQISWQRWVLGVLAALFCATLALWAASPNAHAVPEHSFDAALSLEGSCIGGDGVRDPGCPGGVHPPQAFNDTCGVAVDRHGNIYVASGAIGGTGKEGRIDIFNADGEFLTEIKNEHQPCDLAVDSQGNLYATQFESENKDVTLFEPASYPPGAEEKYTATTVFDGPPHPDCRAAWGVAVDPTDDHLYAALSCMVTEFASAAEGSGVVREGIASFLPILAGIDIYGPTGDLYLVSTVPGLPEVNPENARLYIIDGVSEAIECEVGGFSFPSALRGWRSTRQTATPSCRRPPGE